MHSCKRQLCSPHTLDPTPQIPHPTHPTLHPAEGTPEGGLRSTGNIDLKKSVIMLFSECVV
jgi:hypothetical protein